MYSYYEYAVGYPSDNAGISVVHARTYDTLTLILNTGIVVISNKHVRREIITTSGG